MLSWGVMTGPLRCLVGLRFKIEFLVEMRIQLPVISIQLKVEAMKRQNGMG